MPPSAPLTRGRPIHLPSLTGLRWVAAAVVFGYHVLTLDLFTGRSEMAWAALFNGGMTAVSLFFILSGFVLAWSWRPGPVRAFFWRRAVRLYPLHLVVLPLALLAGATVVPGIVLPGWHPLVANVVLLSAWRDAWWQAGNPVSWSLVCEVFFYATFPLLVRVLGIGAGSEQRRAWAMAAVALVGTWVAPALGVLLGGEHTAYSFPLARLPEFVLGVALGRLMVTGAWMGLRLRWALLVAAAGYLGASMELVVPAAAHALTSLGFALVLAALVRRDVQGRTGLLDHPVLVRLGEWSYAFYLVHLLAIQAVLAVVMPLVPNSNLVRLAVVTAIFIGATSLAGLLHVWVEAPAARLLTRRREPVVMPGRPRELVAVGARIQTLAAPTCRIDDAP